MQYKIFSERTGLKVSELALGMGMFGQTWDDGAIPEEARRIIAGFALVGEAISRVLVLSYIKKKTRTRQLLRCSLCSSPF